MSKQRRHVAVAIAAGAFVLAGLVPATAFAGTAARSASICGTRTNAPTYKHVIVILEENHSYGAIYRSSADPYINSVIAACGLATNYHNVTHNSLPNYLAITSGAQMSQLYTYVNDCAPRSCGGLGNNDIFNQVAKRGWMSFEESMPYGCDKSGSGRYAPKHNPALYYSNLASSCASHDVSLGSKSSSPLLSDFSKESTAPAFSFVTPNLCSDMHDCSVSAGDGWLKTWLPRITATSVYKAKDTAIFIVWDEGEPGYAGESCATNSSDQSCHVAAIVVAPSVRAGTKVSTSFSHYSVLKTVEDLLGVPELGGATGAASMAKGFNL